MASTSVPPPLEASTSPSPSPLKREMNHLLRLLAAMVDQYGQDGLMYLHDMSHYVVEDFELKLELVPGTDDVVVVLRGVE